MIFEILLVFLFSYICGSIPFGLILTKVFLGKDIRKIGSKNIGATNVLRTGNKFIAALTLILDISKGIAPILVTNYYFPNLIYLSSLSAFLGHIFPVWLKFNGGKGVATYLGIILALSYKFFLIFIVSWISLSLLFRFASLSSMISTLIVFLCAYFFEINNNILILFIFFVVILFTHKENILRLKSSTETKIKL